MQNKTIIKCCLQGAFMPEMLTMMYTIVFINGSFKYLMHNIPTIFSIVLFPDLLRPYCAIRLHSSSKS